MANPELDYSKPLGRDIVCVLEEQICRQRDAAEKLRAAGLERECQMALGHAAGFRARVEEMRSRVQAAAGVNGMPVQHSVV